MNWYHSPRAVEVLAAQYVLGTLQGRARRRFESIAAQRPDVAARVQDWEGRLHRLAHSLPEVAPSPALWERMALQAGMPALVSGPTSTATAQGRPANANATAAVAAPGAMPTASIAPVSPAVPEGPAAPAASAPPRARPPQPAPGLLQRLGLGLQALFAPVPAAALAFGLVAGLALPTLMQGLNPPAEQGDTSVPASYIGVLATPAGRQGLIVASLRLGRTVDLKQVTRVEPGPGQTLFLWTLDAQGQAQPVGAIPAGAFVQAPLADTAEKVFAKAVELGVTLEALGSTPVTPSGPWVYRGLCGKVWRAPPASSPLAAPRLP